MKKRDDLGQLATWCKGSFIVTIHRIHIMHKVSIYTYMYIICTFIIQKYIYIYCDKAWPAAGGCPSVPAQLPQICLAQPETRWDAKSRGGRFGRAWSLYWV